MEQKKISFSSTISKRNNVEFVIGVPKTTRLANPELQLGKSVNVTVETTTE